MSDPKRPYWDSVIFLDLGKGRCPPEDPQNVARLDAMWRRSAAGDFYIYTSALTIAEVLRIKSEARPTEAEADRIRAFFESATIVLVDLGRSVAERARDLVWGHNLHPKDAVHVASALEARCDVLYTRDAEVLRLSRAVGGHPILEIKSPSVYPVASTQEPLLFPSET